MDDFVDSSLATSLSNRMDAISESKIRVMFDMAEELDDDLVRLEVGEPDFRTPEHIIRAAYEAALDGATHYTSNAGLPALRRAIAEKMSADNDVDVDPESEIVVTNGGMEALYLAMLAIVDDGDEVIVPTPGWPNYSSQARLAGATVTEVPLDPDSGFDLDPALIQEAISDDTAAVILNRPSNPTGRVFDTNAVAAVTETAADHDAFVIADEVYERLIYEGSQRGMASYVDAPERVLTVNACSKTYAMTGWRLGWLAGNEDVIGAAVKLHQSTSSCASSLSQHAAIAALTGDQEPAREMRDAFEERRDYVVDRVEELQAVSCPRPEGAFYAFLDISALEGDSFEVAKRLMRDYGVVTAPGSGFGEAGEGFLRISFANSLEELERGFDRIERMVDTELDG